MTFTLISALSLFVYFSCRLVLFRYVGVIAHVFCSADVLVCLFVVTVANFGMLSLKVGYRILNCIMNLSSLIFGFYLSLGIPQVLFQVIFVAIIVLSTHSYLEFVCVGGYFDRFLFVGMV